MRFLVATLALALFTGSQAFVLKEQYPELVQLNQEIKEYLRNITRAVNEKIEFIRSLEVGQSLVDQLHAGYSEVSGRLRDLEAELPAEVKEAYERAVGASLAVVEKSVGALRSLKRKVTPATDKVAESLYAIVAPYANSVLGKVSSYTEALRQALATTKELSPKVKEKLEKQLQELRNQLAPYAEKLQGQLRELQASLRPFANGAKEKIRQGVKRVNQTLQPYIAPILEALRKYTADFKEWVDTPVPTPDQ